MIKLIFFEMVFKMKEICKSSFGTVVKLEFFSLSHTFPRIKVFLLQCFLS